MSADYHRHCQATVLGATGDPFEGGLTWHNIDDLNLPNLPDDWKNWFVPNTNITEDLADILRLIDWVAGKSIPSQPGDLIDIDESKISVKNNISNGYSGVVGITGLGQNRQLSACPIRVDNENPDGPVIAKLWVGDKPFEIRALSEYQPPESEEERYVITEDRVYDIVLSGGENDGEPLDYTDETRYVVTENGHEYDIGVSGYGDNIILNYNED